MTDRNFMKIKYSIFKTSWGCFALAGINDGLIASIVPQPSAKQAKEKLFALAERSVKIKPDYTEHKFAKLQNQICNYFDGKQTIFDFEISNVIRYTDFQRSIINACNKIPYGKTVSYKRLGQMVKYNGSSRAVGNVMAANKLPILIPCHRVISADGKIGGYSADAGPEFKKRLIDLETFST